MIDPTPIWASKIQISLKHKVSQMKLGKNFEYNVNQQPWRHFVSVFNFYISNFDYRIRTRLTSSSFLTTSFQRNFLIAIITRTIWLSKN